MHIEEKSYKPYDLRSFRKIPQVEENLSEEQKFAIEVVSHVFPFKSNNYVVEELIDWSNIPNDPMFVLTFPQKGMLSEAQYDKMAACLREHPDDPTEQLRVANEIRNELNPHPAGQMEHNVPDLYGEKLTGMQHKYQETCLFFPAAGQTCHAYCTFCFRWPQFVGVADWKFAMKEVDLLVDYLKLNPQISDVLFTGGDPMVMKAKGLRTYVEPLIAGKKDGSLASLNTIRIGTKSLTYWPYKYVTDDDWADLAALIGEARDAGLHLAVMAHFNHPVELSTPVVQQAIKNLQMAGATIRSQTPLLNHINADVDTWANKWRAEVNLGVIPYYMFVVRDTGAQDFYGVPLVKAHEIFQAAYQQVSGLCRTVRGPSMSADPGKVEVVGPATINGEKVLALRFLQGRDPNWVCKPFFAKYDEKAIWLNDLEPAFGEKKFFFEEELDAMYESDKASGGHLEEMIDQ